MNNTSSLHLEAAQRLSLSVSLQQAIGVLCMSQQELEMYIDSVVEQNPLLFTPEMTISSDESSTNDGDSVQSLNSQDFTNPYDEEGLRFDTASRGATSFDDPQSPDIQDLTWDETVHELLLQQANLTFDNTVEQNIARFLIFNLSPKGYLDDPIEELANLIASPLDRVIAVWERLKTFEPVGIFAKDLQECLIIQLKDRSEYTNVLDVLTKNLDLLSKRSFKTLAKMANVTVKEVEDALLVLKTLKPYPLDPNSVNAAHVYVVPDVIAVWSEKNRLWEARLNAKMQPKVYFSERYYESSMNTCRSPKDKGFLKQKKEQARWFFQAIHQRNRTLLRVAKAILEEQQDFFTQGIDGLKPMGNKNLASMLGVHESTISRITTHKYIQTPRGVFNLKFFFSYALNNLHLQGGLSTKSIQGTIAMLVHKENKKNPLSDENIVTALKNHGIDIARRTVAKYRGILKIPNSSYRRQL